MKAETCSELTDVKLLDGFEPVLELRELLGDTEMMMMMVVMMMMQLRVVLSS